MDDSIPPAWEGRRANASRFFATVDLHDATLARPPGNGRAGQGAGWTVCSGGLFGLGETWDDRQQLALTLKELEVDSVPINFLSPIPGTPLANQNRTRAGNGAEDLSIVRRLVLGMLKQVKGRKTMPNVKYRCAIDPEFRTIVVKKLLMR